MPSIAAAGTERADAYSAFDAAGVYDTYVRRDRDGLSGTHLIVDGVHCAGCVRAIEKGLVKAGAASAQLNFGNHRAEVRWDDRALRLSDLLRALHGLGYEGRPYDPATQESGHRARVRQAALRLGVAAFCAMNVMLYSVGLYAGYFYGMDETFRRLFQWISAGLSLPAAFYAGWPFLRGAWAAARNRRLSMDSLIALGILGTLTHSTLVLLLAPGEETYFESVVMMVFFLLIGRFLETLARGRSGGITERLAGMQVKWATRLTEGGPAGRREESVPIHQVRPGDRLLVRPGEAVPTDGTLTQGETELDESALTGEARRRHARAGDALIGATLNTGAPITMTATRVGADTVLARICQLVEQAQGRKAPLQRLADQVAGHFVGAVLVLAGLSWAYWQLAGQNAPWLIAISVLIIACPCGLGLATPVAVIAGAAAAARRGILVKGGDVLEQAARVTDVVLDKTGTLTTGQLAITRLESLSPMPPAEWFALAAAVEDRTVHPIAQAMRALTESMGGGPALAEPREVSVHPGKGALGTVGERKVIVGSHRLLVEQGLSLPPDAAGVADVGDEGLVYVAVDGNPVGRLTLRDPPRPDAAEAVRALKALGVRVHLLSGDRTPAVRAAAERVGIERFRAEMLPDDKLETIRGMQSEGRIVAMVGDGVNDAPALTQADLSIAVGTGSDLALEAAQVILMRSRLLGAVETLTVARETLRVIRQNLMLSVGYNVVAVPLAMAGLVIPLGAAIAMSASSLVVVANALLLRRRLSPVLEAAAPEVPAASQAPAMV